jgi:hypothetical protein
MHFLFFCKQMRHVHHGSPCSDRASRITGSCKPAGSRLTHPALPYVNSRVRTIIKRANVHAFRDFPSSLGRPHYSLVTPADNCPQRLRARSRTCSKTGFARDSVAANLVYSRRWLAGLPGCQAYDAQARPEGRPDVSSLASCPGSHWSRGRAQQRISSGQHYCLLFSFVYHQLNPGTNMLDRLCGVDQKCCCLSNAG